MILKIVLILGLITFFIICIIIGGNRYKSEYERKIEDDEQIRYLEDCSKHIKKKGI